ncbi:hematopoietic cell signal transducer [Engraulis encrasicolus]|uniref:hematopoietic cell signal transducer n=1 Tax=Engraulis encrasicolus TaxID=184585 RepID=UPI002FD71F65
MERPALLVFLLLCVHEGALANSGPVPESHSCYRIEPLTLALVVVGDIVLTIAIVLVTYYCASRRKRQSDNADKVYMNVRANCKK